MSDRLIQDYSGWMGASSSAAVLNFPAILDQLDTVSRNQWRVPIGEAPLLRRRLCHRRMPADAWAPAPAWHSVLTRVYRDRVIDLERPVCPHRGIPLDGLPCTRRGVVTCPGHGLRWNLRTGKIVTRGPSRRL